MRKPLVCLQTILAVDVTKEHFQKRKAIFLDADNTLFIPKVPLEQQNLQLVTEKLQALQKVYALVVISNNFSQDRATYFEALHIPAIFFAKKPLSFAFKKAKELAELELMHKLEKNEIIHIGDQFLTDGIGSALYGIDYILTTPIDEASDLIYAKPSRFLERLFKIRK